MADHGRDAPEFAGLWRAVSACLLVALVVPAAGCFKMVTLSKPGSPTYVRAMAEATRHEHHGRRQDAVRAYTRAAAAADRRVDRDEAQYREAKMLEQLGRTDEALALLDTIAARRPVSRRTARAVYDAALLRDQTGRHAAALEGFRTVVLEYPDAGLGGRALWYLVRDHRDRGDDEGALALVRSLYPRLRHTSLGDDLLDDEAQVLLDHGDRAGARATLERLVREQPYPRGHRWDDALVQLADLAVQDGDYQRAIGYLKTLVKRHDTTNLVGSYTLPTMSKAALRIARIYRDDLHDPSAAASAYADMASEFPRSRYRDDALLELGELRLSQGRRSEACSLFQQVLDQYDVGHARRLAEKHEQTDCAQNN